MPEGSPHTLFISDLHLDGNRPWLIEGFRAWCRGPARAAQQVFILGDLFEAWVGDDDDAGWTDTVRAELQALVAAGTPVSVQHGNRDFLLGDAFCSATGASLLDEETLIDLYGRRALLLHGDTLCTDDASYQAFRSQVRDPAWQQAVLNRPLSERRALAAQLRNDSRIAQDGKQMQIMDVNADAVAATMRRHGVDLLIHGHTHRPARHVLKHRNDAAAVDGPDAERIVLGDWGPLGWQLRAEDGGELRLEHWSLDTMTGPATGSSG